MTHLFASESNGFLHLGLGYNVSKKEILEAFKRLVTQPELRFQMRERMARADLTGGRKRTLSLIKKILEE
jgi:hypothetical protein